MSSKFGLQVIDPNAPPPPVENCDVLKPMELAEYRKKRAEWLGWSEFRKDEPNNIKGQIIRMTFLDMSYRMLTKPRSETPQDVNIAARNERLAHTLDLGYAATQVFVVCKIARLSNIRQTALTARSMISLFTLCLHYVYSMFS